MTDFSKLACAHLLHLTGDGRPLPERIAQVEADMIELAPPAPGRTDVCGYRRHVDGEGIHETEIRGDGSERLLKHTPHPKPDPQAGA